MQRSMEGCNALFTSNQARDMNESINEQENKREREGIEKAERGGREWKRWKRGTPHLCARDVDGEGSCLG